MNKTLTLLSLLSLVTFLGGAAFGHAESRSASKTTALDRPHQFTEVTRAIVKDSQGQYVGRITDFVLNPDGHISFVVLSPFAMDGTNARLVALPFSVLSFNGKDTVLDTTWDKLVNAPVFSRSYLLARSWAEDTNRYFGLQPSWGEGAEGTLCGEGAIVATQLSMTKGWNRPYEATEIVGARVRDSKGEEVGKIHDLVFDTEGRISSAIIGFGGFIGIGQNLVAVPANSLSFDEEPRRFVLNTTKEEIHSAPLFSRKTLDDPNWAKGDYQ